MAKDVFLSYSAKQRDIAHRLALSLEGQGYDVFFDRTSIPEGSEYDTAIREAVESCDLFVFLISRESVAPGSYPLAELVLAEKRWEHPAGHVLPVRAEPVPIAEIPSYLRAVSILEPRGDFVAETSAAVARMRSRKSKLWWPAGVGIGVVLLLLLSLFAYQRIEEDRARRQQVQNIVAAAELDVDAGRYDAAFRSLGDAAARFTDEPALHRAREQAAMEWLRNIRVRVGEQTFSDVVNAVHPVLAERAAAAKGAEAADLFAHLGWCEYLRAREGRSSNPVIYFERAVDAEPANPFAHAMWGFWILYRNGPPAEATSHFETAAASGRELAWARNLQIAALIMYGDPDLENEAIRVASVMRKEQLPVAESGRLWSIYTSNLMNVADSREFLDALPGTDHLATFLWLFPEKTVTESRLPVHRLLTGRLHEAAGNRDDALAAYRWVEDHMQRENSFGSLLDRSREGIGRLTAR